MFKILTEQYPQFNTRKFEIDYLAFKPGVTNISNLIIKNEKTRSALIHAQIKPEVIFAGTGMTSAMLYLTCDIGINAPNIDNASFLIANAGSVPSATKGSAKAAPLRYRGAVATSDNIILNQTTFSTIYIQLKLNAGAIIDNMTAGRFFLWYTIFQLK